MQFIKAGEPADSNIFNKLDERKRRLLASGRDVINLSDRHAGFPAGPACDGGGQPRGARSGAV